MKKKLFGITIIVVIIGIIVVALKGFNVNFKYKEHKAITIPINTDFNINDIQSIADEMFGKNTCYLEKAGIYNDEVIINVKDITEEQIESLKQTINGLTNTVSEKYEIKQKINIKIKEEYNLDDIKAIINDTISKEVINVEKSNDDATYVVIESRIITEDELENLNRKINEKYQLSNTTSSIGATQIITITDIPRVRLIDMAKQYELYIAIASVIILVYFAIRFKNIGLARTVLGTILAIILSELLYMSIIAITRYPIDKMAIIGAIAIYMLVVTFLNARFINQTYNAIKK